MLLFYLSLIPDEEDKRLFETLYINYRDAMFATANGVLQNGAMAEDAVHDAFLRIIDMLPKLKNYTDFQQKSYLLIAARNVAINIYNHEHKIAINMVDGILEFVEDVEHIEKAENEYRQGLLKRVLKGIASMEEIDREVLLLHYIHELPHKDVAKTLAISESAARKRFERANRRLKGICKDEKNEV